VTSVCLCWCVAALPSTMAKPASMTSICSLSEIIGTSQQSSKTPYVPDFTVRAISDLQYIRIRRAHYMVALHATLLERQRRGTTQIDGTHGAQAATPDDDEDTFTKEWRRAQRVLSVSPSGATRSDAESVNDDVSVRDVSISNPADGTGSDKTARTKFSTGFSPRWQRSGSLSSPQDTSSSNNGAFKHRLESQLFT